MATALVHDRKLGLTAAAGDRHHAVAGRESAHAFADRHDLAGELHPGNVMPG